MFEVYGYGGVRGGEEEGEGVDGPVCADGFVAEGEGAAAAEEANGGGSELGFFGDFAVGGCEGAGVCWLDCAGADGPFAAGLR